MGYSRNVLSLGFIITFAFMFLLLNPVNGNAELYMSISGTVTDVDSGKGIAGTQIYVVRDSQTDKKTYAALSDVNGSFIARMLAAGIYKVYIVPPNYSYADVDPIQIAVEKGKNITELSIRLNHAGSISGKVMQSDGKTPIKGARIMVITDSNNNGAFVLTDDYGGYTISGLRETKSAVVYLMVDGYGSMNKSSIEIQQNQNSIVDFVFNPDVNTGIKGKIASPNGTGVSNALIMFEGENGSGSAVADVNGSYTVVGLPAGSYNVQILAGNYQMLDNTNITISANNINTVDFSLTGLSLSNKFSFSRLAEGASNSGTPELCIRPLKALPFTRAVVHCYVKTYDDSGNAQYDGFDEKGVHREIDPSGSCLPIKPTQCTDNDKVRGNIEKAKKDHQWDAGKWRLLEHNCCHWATGMLDGQNPWEPYGYHLPGPDLGDPDAYLPVAGLTD
jgi:hypothetical protein